MTILAFYIFREDGAPLLSRFYDNRASMVDGLVAPFLVGINNRMEELAGSGLREVRLQENTFLFVEQFAEVLCAVVTSERGRINLDLELVARKFYKSFHSQISDRHWKGRTTDLDQFVPEIETILHIDSDMMINSLPSKYLDAFAMSEYSKPIQQLIRQLITKTELSESDFTDIPLAENQIRAALKELEQDGYIGIKTYVDGTRKYFTRI